MYTLILLFRLKFPDQLLTASALPELWRHLERKQSKRMYMLYILLYLVFIFGNLGLDQQLQVEYQRGLLNFTLPMWHQQQVQEIHSSSLPKEVRREYARDLRGSYFCFSLPPLYCIWTPLPNGLLCGPLNEFSVREVYCLDSVNEITYESTNSTDKATMGLLVRPSAARRKEGVCGQGERLKVLFIYKRGFCGSIQNIPIW